MTSTNAMSGLRPKLFALRFMGCFSRNSASPGMQAYWNAEMMAKMAGEVNMVEEQF